MRERTAVDSRNYIVAFELRSAADCPADFHLPPAAASLDTGIFLPRDNPDWFGRSAYPARVLLLSCDAFRAVPHPSANEPPWLCLIEHISSVESGHMLLKGWLSFRGAGFNYMVPYNTRGHPSVLRFMRRFRERWLGTGGLPAAGVSLGEDFDLRFANALADELDPGEAVAARFFQSPRESKRRCALHRSRWIPGDLLALTGRRVIWITDRHHGLRAQFGSISCYAPLRAVQGLGLASRPSGSYLQVSLDGESPWLIPIAAGHRSAAEEFAARVLSALSHELYERVDA